MRASMKWNNASLNKFWANFWHPRKIYPWNRRKAASCSQDDKHPPRVTFKINLPKKSASSRWKNRALGNLLKVRNWNSKVMTWSSPKNNYQRNNKCKVEVVGDKKPKYPSQTYEPYKKMQLQLPKFKSHQTNLSLKHQINQCQFLRGMLASHAGLHSWARDSEKSLY